MTMMMMIFDVYIDTLWFFIRSLHFSSSDEWIRGISSLALVQHIRRNQELHIKFNLKSYIYARIVGIKNATLVRCSVMPIKIYKKNNNKMRVYITTNNYCTIIIHTCGHKRIKQMHISTKKQNRETKTTTQKADI